MSAFSELPLILLVDDIATNIQTLSGALRDEYRVRVANSGQKALEIARAEPQPDLILLDIMMPDLDGFEVCRRLKADSETKNIPVIFVTTRSEFADEERGLMLGAVDYITKPLHIPIVRARVHNHIQLKRHADMLESLALIDPLTHIPNRRRFDEALEAEWKRAERTGAPLTMLMIDIDHFKEYNDYYGHGAGDAALRAVASALTAGVERSGDVLARYGGEEFAAILPGITASAAVRVAEKLLENVSSLAIPHARSLTASYLTISIGCAAQVPGYSSSAPQSLLHASDNMLYKAKQEGRNRYAAQS